LCSDGRWYIYDPTARKAQLVSRDLHKYCEYKYYEIMREQQGELEELPKEQNLGVHAKSDAMIKLGLRILRSMKRRADERHEMGIIIA
jgi:hypothetical protein